MNLDENNSGKSTAKTNPLLEELVNLLSTLAPEGTETLFLSSQQAIEIRKIFEQKMDIIPVELDHVLCSRVLDFWNLDEYGSVGCEYVLDRDMPPVCRPNFLLKGCAQFVSRFEPYNRCKMSHFISLLNFVTNQHCLNCKLSLLNW